MLKITFYVPTKDKEKVKQAMFKAGAGKIGHYDCCSFEVEGQGQFRPLDGSHPTLGLHHQVEVVNETRVEMICGDHSKIRDIIAAMEKAHPYETVAYDVVRTEMPENMTTV